MFKEKLTKITIRIFYVLFAVVVSVAIWLYVEITENEDQVREVPGIEISFRNEDLLRDKGLLRTSVLPETLSITFEGSRSDISRLLVPGALTVEVDLATVNSAGTSSLAYEIIWPTGVNSNAVEILGWSDSRITISVDRILERQIPVWVRYMGGTASNELIAEEAEWDPHSITVWGPEEVVSKIHHILVPIFRENLATTYTDELEFILIDENDEELDTELRETVVFSQETIRVIVPIREIKDVTLSVNLFHGDSTTDENTSWNSSPQVITVAGDPAVLRDFNNIQLGPIDMLSFGLEDTFPFTIIIPDHITNISGETIAHVHVEVFGLDIAFRSTTNLQVINTPPGYRADILTQSLDVRLRGTIEDLVLVTSMNLRIVADLADLNPGTSRVSARVYIDGVDADIDPVGEYLMTVTIVPE